MTRESLDRRLAISGQRRASQITMPPHRPAELSGLAPDLRITTALLAVATAVSVYLSWLLLLPFVKTITWALAMAVAAHPLHRWISRKIARKSLAAAISTLLVVMIVVGPGVPLIRALIHEAGAVMKWRQDDAALVAWRAMIDQHRWLAPMVGWFQSNIDLGTEAARIASGFTSWLSSFIADSAWLFVQFAVSVFTLFYLFRDGAEALVSLRSWVPLSAQEADQVLSRVSETTYATLYGHLLASLAQGLLGGLMFWWLGLSAPLLWGTVMALLAVIPVLGAFLVWLPAALLLFLKGSWIKALILLLWGAFVVGLVDNLIYPILVGRKVRLHTIPIFFSIMGGLFTFGVSGLILGPVILAVTIALLKIWRVRFRHSDAR
jgi:predicted PurR-regulated permease PerM